jgi:hypothetical protein
VTTAERSDSHEDIEAEAERLGGALYGTIVTAGVLVTAGDPGGGAALDVAVAAVYAVATTVVFWLAHGLSHVLARRAAGHPEAEVSTALRREWPMVAATGPLLAIMAVASLLGTGDEQAISAAIWGSVVVLGSIGLVIARRENATGIQTLAMVIGCVALGGLLVLLKVIVH